jgi:hypothetical protein
MVFFILLATHTLPRFSQGLLESQVESQLDRGLEEGLLLSSDNGWHAEPGSVQSFEDYRNQEETARMVHFLENEEDMLAFTHMQRSPSRLSQARSIHDSDIDLDEYPQARGVSLGESVGTGALNQSPRPHTEGVRPCTNGAIHSLPSGNYDDTRPSPLASEAAICPTSNSAEQEAPLLGEQVLPQQA